MSKMDLVEKIFVKGGLPTKGESESFLDAVLEVLVAALERGEPVTLTGFGSFKVVERGERKGRNPRTGEECVIPASRGIRFTPGKLLKEAVQ